MKQNNMTPKEKANQVVKKYWMKNKNSQDSFEVAIKNALICVNEILDFMNQLGWKELENGNVDYWQEVKTKIEQL